MLSGFILYILMGEGCHMEGFHSVKRYSVLLSSLCTAQKLKANNAYIFLQAIFILNTENFINKARVYWNTKMRDPWVKALLTQLTPSSCMQLSCIYPFAYMDHGNLKCHVLFSKDHFQREIVICQIQLPYKIIANVTIRWNCCQVVYQLSSIIKHGLMIIFLFCLRKKKYFTSKSRLLFQ